MTPRVALLLPVVFGLLLGGYVAGCGSPRPQKRTLFNFEPVSARNPSLRAGVVPRDEGEGPDRYSYKVPERRLLWVTEGIDRYSYGTRYSNSLFGDGYEEGTNDAYHEYPSNYFVEKRNEPVSHDGGEMLGFDVQPSEQTIAPEGDVVSFRVRIAAPSSKSSVLPANNVAIVLDFSESLREPEKLELLRRVALYLVDQILPADRVLVLLAGDGVKVALRTAETPDAAALHALIERTVPSGRGSLAAALDAAYQELGGIVLESGEPAHVLLVTDGLAGRGGMAPWRFVDMALRRHAGKGVRLSTIGVGHQMDSEFLSSLARAADGRFAYLEAGESVETILGPELRRVFQLLFQNVRLRITHLDGGQVLSVHGLEFPEPLQVVDEVALSDFVAGEERSLLLKVRYPPAEGFSPVFRTRFKLFFERSIPVARNVMERAVTLRAGAKGAGREPGVEERSVEVFDWLLAGLERIGLALSGGGEAAAKAVAELSEAEFPGIRDEAIRSADRDLVYHAELFEYFAARLRELAAKGQLYGVSAERDALGRMLRYRRLPLGNG